MTDSAPRLVTRNFAQAFTLDCALASIRALHGAHEDSARFSYAFERVAESSYLVRVQANHGAKLYSTLGYIRAAPL